MPGHTRLLSSNSIKKLNAMIAAALLSSLLGAQMVTAQTATTKTVPVGIYSIDDASLLDKSFVDGVLVRVSWEQCQPTQDKFDFSQVTSAVTKARAAGKKVSIALLTFRTPKWLMQDPEIATMKGYKNMTVPAPWDAKAQKHFSTLISKLANTVVDGYPLKSHPSVANVNTTILGLDSLRVLTSLSTSDLAKLKQGVLDSISIWRSHFNDASKSYYLGLFAFAGPTGISDCAAIRDSILDRFPEINFYQELLTGISPSGPLFQMLDEVKDRTGIMFQWLGVISQQNTVWANANWLKNDKGVNVDTPGNGFSHGYYDLGAKYYECYPLDLKNASYTAEYQTWHKILHAR